MSRPFPFLPGVFLAKYHFRSFALEAIARNNAVNPEGEDVVVKDHLENLVFANV